MAKVYYFTVIAVGVMFLLSLAGVDTNSNQIIDFVSGNNPSGWQSSGFWIAVIAAMVGYTATSSISIGTFSIKPSTEAIAAIFITAIYAFFAMDFYSVVTKVYTITGGTGWEYWGVWALFIPLLTGYGISLVNYIGGGDY